MKPGDIQRALDAIDALDRVSKTSEALPILSDMLAHFGFSHFLFLDLPEASTFEQSVFCWRLPEEWFRIYVSQGYERVDPALRFSGRTNRPFIWRDAPYDPEREPGAVAFLRHIRDYGLADGLVIPVRGAGGRPGLAWFGGGEPDFRDGPISILHLLAHYAFHRLREIDPPPHDRRPLLTSREREVLTWMAVGKTAVEIGDILKITKRTVDFHAQTICRKFGAINRTHAVALGLRSGAIRP